MNLLADLAVHIIYISSSAITEMYVLDHNQTNADCREPVTEATEVNIFSLLLSAFALPPRGVVGFQKA